MFSGRKSMLGILALAIMTIPASEAFPSEVSSSAALPRNACGCEGEVTLETEIRFEQTYTGRYRTGEPYDYVTVNPNGTGETFADVGISIRARIWCENRPVSSFAGTPADLFQLYSTDLCMCVGKFADAAADEDGWVAFSGTLRAGGCAEGIDLWVDGVFAGTLPINFNSTDTAVASPCHTDAADLAAFAEVFGDPNAWGICFDYNESGPPTIDASDLAYFAARLGATCE